MGNGDLSQAVSGKLSPSFFKHDLEYGQETHPGVLHS